MSPKTLSALALFLLGVASGAHAVSFDANITPDVIFGTGNANGGWTVDQANGVELGLRAKLRFDAANNPQNIFNSNGDGTYTFDAGLPPTGFSSLPGSTSTALWNFEWAVNVDLNDEGRTLDSLTYQIDIDFDPGPGTNFLSFDPVIQNALTFPLLLGNAFGNSTTPNGGGDDGASTPSAYNLALGSNSVAQNSWNMEFIDNAGAGFPFDGRNAGEYTFQLSAFDGSAAVAQTSIIVNVVPEPASLALVAMGLASVVARRRR